MKELYLYKKLSNNQAQCLRCSHYCIISEGEVGICGTVKNIQGRLYSLNYKKLCAINIDPIEKKPFYHFLPGTNSLSIASAGCNFACYSCQNWYISQGPKLYKKIEGEEYTPEEIVEIALKNNLPSISYTYTEPTIFLEFALETMKLAKKAKLKNTWVSNGFWSRQTFDLISPYLDAVNVDLKSFEDDFYLKYCGGKLKPVLDNLIRVKKAKIHLEVTTLVIPSLNDKPKIFKDIARFIKSNLGPDTPWHITQFCGSISWKLKQLPDTPIEVLKEAYQIGKEMGLKYVYIGNIPGLEAENTYCPKCGAKMISRVGYTIQRIDKNGKCSKCGTDLNIVE